MDFDPVLHDLEQSMAPDDSFARWRQKLDGAAGKAAMTHAQELDKAHRSNVDDLGAQMSEVLEGNTRAIDRVLRADSPRRERPNDGRKSAQRFELNKAINARLAGLRDWVKAQLEAGETLESLVRFAESRDPETAEEIRQCARELKADDGIRTVYA